MTYLKKVFINCPYDNEYLGILYAIIFMSIKFKIEPHLAMRVETSSTRMEIIEEAIKTTNFGVHDISRVELDSNDLPRFNMPFELGMDYAYRKYCQPTKQLIIFEKERYSSKKYLSDLTGVDIEHHNSDVSLILDVLRSKYSYLMNLNCHAKTKLYDEYNIDFMPYILSEVLKMGYSIEEYENGDVKINEIIKFTESYFSQNSNRIAV